ncbi:MAG: nucleotidyltransferase domain-containing protein [Calditrichaeota bacterium]|nr:MAG: nucleotidyltransferase domain-containing protein [Calditrichota bacterium]
MTLTPNQKEEIKRAVREALCSEAEVQKIIIFGSFLTSDEPVDIDIAIFQTSSEPYLPLAMKYRKKLRPISRILPVDVIPLRPGGEPNSFLAEILSGEVIYEKGNE